LARVAYHVPGWNRIPVVATAAHRSRDANSTSPEVLLLAAGPMAFLRPLAAVNRYVTTTLHGYHRGA
jgi:hypothetical protein